MLKKLQFKHYIIIALIIFCVPIAFYSFSLVQSQYERFASNNLNYHELLGGHTISKHIKITDEQMLSRFVDGATPKAVSKFYDLGIAEKSIKKILEDNKVDVVEFLSSYQEYFLLNGGYTQNVGYGTTYQSYSSGKADFIHTNNLVIVLKRYKGTVFVLTAYPEIK